MPTSFGHTRVPTSDPVSPYRMSCGQNYERIVTGAVQPHGVAHGWQGTERWVERVRRRPGLAGQERGELGQRSVLSATRE